MAASDRLESAGREARDAVWNPALKARGKAEQGRGWYAVLARAGLVAKGASFVLVGVLAVKLALGNGGKATSRQGALQTLAQHSFGKVVLVLLAGGFAAYAIWRLVQAFAEREDPSEGEAKGEAKKWGKRAGYLGRGAIYASLTYTVIKILAGAGGGESQNRQAHKTAGELFSWPAGRWIVGAAGLAILGAGLWNAYRGLTRRFEDKWRAARGRWAKKWGSRAGVVGHLARGVVFGLIGIFVTKAALDYNPKDAIGLDGALQKLVNAPYGPWALGATAAGLVAYGLYCFVDAALRDVSANA
jgi:hypothetical protein